MRSGQDLTFSADDTQLTPAQAAKILGMSRGHLYKLLDSGIIPSTHVGRDRRLKLSEVGEYAKSRQRDQALLAERFAHADRDRQRLLRSLLDS
ncbi:excisionase family DNA-binding protein [Nakamurella sp. YIM 132087]|uniref:Excisionase family DNA-binding protein n=2 Tax=Nakamurella alba TaxID=2665158 RepID=A0A7K1FFN8_9ACTN|nr:excisionase family DNA-binding protein [Nakamurella alba]